MARYRADNAAERRTASLRSWVTPEERQRLEAEARAAGNGLSDYVRQLCLRRAGQPQAVAGTRRNTEAKQLASELRDIGNNLNQLTRVANQVGDIRREEDLERVIDLLKVTMSRVIAL